MIILSPIVVLFAIFDFITALLDITDSPNSTSSLAHLFSPILPDLIFYLISLMQITTEQVSVQPFYRLKRSCGPSLVCRLVAGRVT